MDKNKALSRAMKQCARSEQAIGDIRKKLAGWGVMPDDSHDIIQYLKDQDFINEARFAHAFVRDKLAINRWGRIKIRYHLRSKEIGSDAIDLALLEIDELQYTSILKQILDSKLKSLQHESDRLQIKAKLVRFAAGRGFEPDQIYPLVDQLMKQV